MHYMQYHHRHSRAEYFATLTDNNQSNPRMFYILSHVIDPPPGQLLDATSEKCEEFLSFSTQKITNIRSCISPPDFPITVENPCPVSLCAFNTISPSTLSDIVTKMKPSTCKFLKDVFNNVPFYFANFKLHSVDRLRS